MINSGNTRRIMAPLMMLPLMIKKKKMTMKMVMMMVIMMIVLMMILDEQSLTYLHFEFFCIFILPKISLS